MTYSLEGVIGKIDRADEHIKNLNADINTYIRDNYRLASRPDDDTSQHIVSAFGPERPAMPIRFAVVTGEIVHQLRSSLDHLITALYLANRRGRAPTRDHQFPICDKREKFETAVENGNVKGISASAVELIKGCQPYLYVERGESIEFNKFRILQEMDNADKHRLMMMTDARVGGNVIPEFAIGASADRDESPIEITSMTELNLTVLPTHEGTEIARIYLGKPDPHVQVTGKPPVYVAFGDCGPRLQALTKQPVIKVVQDLRDRIAVCINSFAAEFPPPR